MKHHGYAQTPPLGWNSWDCYGASVTEEEVRGNADYMAEHLKKHGWEYVVVDIQWYEPQAYSSRYRPFVPLEMDEYSRLIPAANRFPSAADGGGFRELAAYVHGLGLKFGIHIMRGIPRQAVHADTKLLGTEATARQIAHTNSICPWNTDMYGVDPEKEGAQEYYDSLFALYADWGVDYVKVDDIADSRLYGYHEGEVELIRRAIENNGRDMVLSLSPGPAHVDKAEHLIANANLWRMTDDYWDHWFLLRGMFERCEAWAPHVGPGHFPDCDMLPLGRIGIRSVDGGEEDRMTRFTKGEQVTMMTLWSLFRSPLMFGGELRSNDEWTLSLLTNDEVLAVSQEGSDPRPLPRREGDPDDIRIWTSRRPDGGLNVGLFNLGDEPAEISLALNEIASAPDARVRDLWARLDAAAPEGLLRAELPPHGSRLYAVGAPL